MHFLELSKKTSDMNLLWETSTKYLLHIKLTHRNVKATVELACFQQTNVNLGTLLVSDNVRALLVVHSVALGSGHHIPLSLVLRTIVVVFPNVAIGIKSN